VKQTFNLAPSLMLQIEDYVNYNTSPYPLKKGELQCNDGQNSPFLRGQGGCNGNNQGTQDKIQRLTKIKAKFLTKEEKQEILDSFFVLNYENLVQPYPRFKELFHLCQNNENVVNDLKTQDWIDIQVWYNLAWLGQISRQSPFAQRLFRKGSNFTEDEKLLLLEFHNEILRKITPEMAFLKKLGQIDISCSPMQHPILPLLCDSTVAKEAMPNLEMPNPIYKFPEDAKAQINNGINYYAKLFNAKPSGMWPSEGSVSNEALELIADSGIKWVASDEGVLAASMKENYRSTYKYFPHEISTKSGDLTMFFRDHNLSDKIGFLYSNWDSFDAANDFREALIAIRNEIIREHGDDALDSAVVPIILDGENCWEFYYENGIYFLREFFNMLNNCDVIETVLFSECLNLPRPNFLPTVKNIRAGSWINANFSIWIGHQDDRKAWNMLSTVRHLIEKNKSKLSKEKYEQIMEEIYIAEGSDWFWWYGPEHNAANKQDFDVIFRWRISEIYKMLDLPPPADLDIPITVATVDNNNTVEAPKSFLTPRITGSLTTFEDWKDAGKINLNSGMSTMHRIGEIISEVRFCYDDNFVFFRIELMEFIKGEDLIELNFVNKKGEEIKILHSNNCFDINSQSGAKILMSSKDVIDIGIAAIFFDRQIKLSIKTVSDKNTINYPNSDYFIFEW
jgi:alpha-amylase/alpha-mannosidase (GH57 family)